MSKSNASQRLIDAGTQQPDDQRLTTLFGAILLSAVGSLPLHLVPVIIVALIADGRVAVVEAGWIASAIVFGLLLTALAMPVLKILILRRMQAVGTALLLIFGLVITASAGSFPLYLGWFVVGSSGGVLMYLGTISASNYHNATFAFSLRLGIVLVLAGSVTCGLILSVSLTSYPSLLTTLMIIFSCLLALGLLLYRPTSNVAASKSQVPPRRWQFPQAVGLAALYILFVGQTGFLSYVVQEAVARGMTIAESTWAIVTMKILAGAWLVSVAAVNVRGERRHRLLEFGGLLAISLGIASFTTTPIVFFLSLLTFEIAFNTVSARFQAEFAEANRKFAGQWLTGVLLLGAACGPPLYGAAIGADLTFYFLLLAMFSAFIPGLWSRIYSSTHSQV